MEINLNKCERELQDVMDDVGIGGHSRCINLELWKHANGVRKVTVQISVFDKDDICQQATGPTWDEALAVMRVRLKGFDSLSDENVTVVIDDGL